MAALSHSLAHRIVLAACLAAALTSAAWAHDTWLLPDHFEVPVGKTVTIEMTSGMRFPRLESSIERARVARAEARLAGTTVTLGQRRSQTHALAFLQAFRTSGVATLVVELKARTLELTPLQVKEYLDEIGAAPNVRQAWAASPGKVWTETYTKHAKTFLRVGEHIVPGAAALPAAGAAAAPAPGAAAVDAAWRDPLGLALELVPDSDPTALTAGSELALRLLRDGQPLPGLAVGVVRESAATGSLQTTDAAGRVVVRFEKSGRYLLRATELRPVGTTGDRWTSDFTTVTLDVH